uniref:RNase_PH domain-containing protein n=1 Tax=Elaeophora elaphi TaxID=1147741 RepID=A0A0R3RUL4_9BILA
MLVGGIELEPEPNVNLLVILCGNEEVITDNDTFHLLCGICAANIVSDRTKLYWLRHQPPTLLPKESILEPWQLSRITLRYFNEKLISGVTAFCASAHTFALGEAAVIVEFSESDIPHEESLSTILALLSDLGNYFSMISKGALFERNIFPVTALIRTSRIYDYGLIASLYTNCILCFENGICKNMLAK